MRDSILKERKLILVFFLTCIGQVFSMIFLEVKKGRIIELVFDLDLYSLLVEFTWLIVLTIMMLGFGYIYSVKRTSFIQLVTYDLRRKFFLTFSNEDIRDQFETNKSELLSRYNMEIGMVERQFLTMLTLFMEMVLQILLILLALLWISPALAFFSALIFIIPIIVPRIYEIKFEAISKERKNFIQEHMGRFISWLNSFELIKNFGLEEKLEELYRKENDSYMEVDFRFFDESARNIGVSFLTSLGAQALIIILSGIFLLKNSIGLGDFVAISGLVGYLRIPSFWISTYYQMIISTRPVRQSLEDFIKLGTCENLREGLIDPVNEISIRYENISYSYDKENYIIKDLDLEIKGNKKVLIRGDSGSGKTTLVGLLLAYDKPDYGRITINGLEVSSIANLEDIITISKQEAILFNDSLRNNLTMHSQDLDDEALIECLEALGLYQGLNYRSLDDIVEEGASNFSGGEKKRISLARSLLKKSKTLILDEPLANIDMENLNRIEDYIMNIKDRTLIIISHQFNEDSLGDFDLILNFEGGRIYEEVHP